jgi:hypothetical protein
MEIKTKMRSHLPNKKDANHDAVSREFQQAGFLVSDEHNGDFCDILVGAYRRVFAFEIKVLGKRKNLTKKQKEMRFLWGNYIHTIETAKEGIDIIQREVSF